MTIANQLEKLTKMVAHLQEEVDYLNRRIDLEEKHRNQSIEHLNKGVHARLDLQTEHLQDFLNSA